MRAPPGTFYALVGSQTLSLIGSRMSIASYGSGQPFRQSDWPISVSPASMPIYTVPDSGSTRILLFCSVLAVIIMTGTRSVIPRTRR